MSAPLLSLRGIELVFGGTHALRGVTFDVAANSVFALIGPNGAGKSSLINCVSGFYRPTSGAISFDGTDLATMAPFKRARAGIARTFQNVEIVPELSVLDNILVGREKFMRSSLLSSAFRLPSAQRSEDEHRERVEEVIDFLELEHLRKRTAGSLAHGQKKLVEVARALAADPKLLLLDEPTSGMNREEKEDMARFILRMRYERDITIVLVEHDIAFVSDLCDQAIVLDAGALIAAGTPRDVLREPQVVEAYLGAAATDEQAAPTGGVR